MNVARLTRTSLALTLLTGCMMEAGDAGYAEELMGEDVGLAEQPLYGNKNYYWPNAGTGRTDINVCWENPGSAPGGTAAERAAWRDARRRAVEESWGRHARINFYGWDGTDPVNRPTTCTSGAPGIHVVICNLPSDARCPALPASQAGGGYPTIDGLNNGVRLNPNHGAAIAVHEFGHTLGFYHEEERPDAPNITSGACAKQSWPNDNPALYGGYDQTSIMSYCQPPSAAPWVSANDIASIQRSYGRRKVNSLLTPRASCAAAHHAVGLNDRAFTWDCDEANRDQEWIDTSSTSDGDAWNLYMVGPTNSNQYCLGASSASSGSAVALRTCSTSTDWRFQSMYVRGFGGLCLDLQAGNTAEGTPIQVWQCGALGGQNQRWTRTRSGLLKYGTSNKCARVGDNGRLQLATCNTADSAQVFSFSSGKIRRVSTGKCLDVYGPSDAQFTSGQYLPENGSFVQELTCNTALNQKWHFSGNLRYGASASLCLARGVDANGSALSLASCSADEERQTWDYHF